MVSFKVIILNCRKNGHKVNTKKGIILVHVLHINMLFFFYVPFNFILNDVQTDRFSSQDTQLMNVLTFIYGFVIDFITTLI